MLEFFTRLFDTKGFVERRRAGDGWTPELVWLHVTSDLFTWLAFVSIPLVLLYFTRRRDLPFPRIFVLFALLILACGTTHLTDALTFDFPVYRFEGVLKLLTAILSWVTVIALVPVIPRVMTKVAVATQPGDETKPHRVLPSRLREPWARGYIVAILAGLLAVLFRAAINPIVAGDHVFVVALLAVVYVSWQHGFGPGVLCLAVGLVGYSFFFLPPTGSIFVFKLGPQLAVALFFFCGVACAALGESQRVAQRGAKAALRSAVSRQMELESEVVRRRVVEAALRQRETELVAAQRETAQALARLDAFLDNAPVGIAFFDPQLRYVRINPYLANVNGKPVAEHTGRTLAEVLPDFPKDVLENYARIATAQGGSRIGEVRRPDIHQPGTWRTFRATAFPVHDHEGQTIGAGVFVLDETDRLKAEAELRRSERNLADFFENANVGLHWVNAEGVITRANKAEMEMLGYSREEYVGHPIAEFHTRQEATSDYLDRLLHCERLDNHPVRLRCKDGSTRDVLVSSSVLRENGEFIHVRCFTRDVTALTRAHEALRESESRFRSLADNAPAMIWVSESDGQRTYFNRTWREFTGRTIEEEIECDWEDDVHPDHQEGFLAEYSTAMIERRAFEMEYLMRQHDGEYRWVLSRITPRLTSSGEFVGFVGLCLDVTKRREAADELRLSDERYRIQTEAVPNIVWNADRAGEITYLNRRWLDYTSVSLEEARGEGWLVGVHPGDRERVTRAWRETVDLTTPGRGDHFHLEFRLREAATGNYRWFLSLAVPLRNAQGRIDRWIGSMTDIHDQKTAADAIRESEAFRRSIFDNTPDALTILDFDGRVLEINRAGQELLELATASSFIGRDWSDYWPVANHQTIRDGIAAARGGGVGRFQGFCPTAKGTPKYWDVSLAALPHVSNSPFRIIAVSRDITENRRAEERVRESEEMFRQLAESIPQLAWMAEADGSIFWYNQRWYDYTGTTFAEMKGWGWRSVQDPIELPRVEAKFRRSIETGEAWEDTFPLLGRDGKFRWHLSRAVPMRDASGAIIRWFGTNTDVSTQREMEESVRASERRFRTLTEAVPQMVWTADPSGEVTFVNRRWEEYTGSSPDEELDWGNGRIHPEDLGDLRSSWRHALAVGVKLFAHEFRLLRSADNTYRWMLAVAVPLSGENGVVSEWVGTLTDIEDQKRQTQILEELVQERTAELQRSNEELEKFAYIASHDLQEPLRKIQAFGDRLRTKCRDQLPEVGQEYVERMHSAASRMRKLIDDLLSFSRVTTQHQARERLSLDTIVADVLVDLEERLAQTDGTVRVGPLPIVDGEPTQMRQLFQNLLANAIKFHRPGVAPVIEVGCEHTQSQVETDTDLPRRMYRITVSDNGIGFDDKYRDRIFDMFQRLHGRNEYDGTGIGLTICRKIAERHGGTITAHGKDGEGASFSVLLPVPDSATLEADVDDVRSKQAHHNPAGRR